MCFFIVFQQNPKNLFSRNAILAPKCQFHEAFFRSRSIFDAPAQQLEGRAGWHTADGSSAAASRQAGPDLGALVRAGAGNHKKEVRTPQMQALFGEYSRPSYCQINVFLGVVEIGHVSRFTDLFTKLKRLTNWFLIPGESWSYIPYHQFGTIPFSKMIQT